MRFGRFLLEQEEIHQPYYRVVNGTMFGVSAKEKLGHELAPGSYWTPRWDSVIMMLTTIIQHYKPNDLMGDRWKTTVYQLNHAIMDDAPADHKWAFKFHVDAGEKVLVKTLEKPQIAIDPSTGIKIDNLMPDSHEFLEIMIANMHHTQKPPVDWTKQGAEAILDGNKKVYVGWDYDDTEISIVEPKNAWEFKTLFTFKSYKDWVNFKNRIKFTDHNSYGLDGLEWFLVDMDKDAREGKYKARNWHMDWDK